MPGFDGTGPSGAGSMMGRGFGPCAMSVGGRGLGFGSRKRFGRGRGLGCYFGWGQPRTQQDQVQSLKDYKQALVEELEDVEKELVKEK